MSNTEKTTPPPLPMHDFKEKRRQERFQLEAPKREAAAKKLAELTAMLDAQVGQGITTGMKIELITDQMLRVTAPQHVPIAATFDKGVGTFSVRRHKGVSKFDHFGDALIFAEPYKLSPAGITVDSFDTTKRKK